MTHTYTLSGLTCQGCVANVKRALSSVPAIKTVEVTLSPQQAVISMERHIPAGELQHVVGAAGNYTISEDAEPGARPAPEATWFETYKPIVLIFAFITGVSLLTSSPDGAFHGMMFMSVFMSAFFLTFSFFKFLDLKRFAESYRMYDLLAARFPAYGYLYPFLELALGIAYLTGFRPLLTSLMTLVIMGVSTIGVVESVWNKKKIRCACLGAVFNFPMSTVTIIEDLLMVVMAAIMLVLA
jgi:copper chaperone CopZ